MCRESGVLGCTCVVRPGHSHCVPVWRLCAACVMHSEQCVSFSAILLHASRQPSDCSLPPFSLHHSHCTVLPLEPSAILRALLQCGRKSAVFSAILRRPAERAERRSAEAHRRTKLSPRSMEPKRSAPLYGRSLCQTLHHRAARSKPNLAERFAV